MGSMAERCRVQGHRLAVPPARDPSDDGAVPRATLAACGAQRVDDRPSAVTPSLVHGLATGGYAGDGGGAAETEPVHAPPAARFDEIPPEVASEDKDPFGHVLLGFDDSPAAVPAGDVAARSLPAEEVPGPDMSAAVESASPQAKGAHPSHAFRLSGYVVWCAYCGRHAASRLGIGLLRQCRGHADGGYPSRILRLKVVRPPITGDQL